MKLNEFQEKAMSYCTESSLNPMYMFFGGMAEAGEVADKFAKAIRKEQIQINKNQITYDPEQFGVKDVKEWKEELAKEVFDELWFIAGKAIVLGYTLEQLAELGLAKLQSRKERGVIVGDGDNR